MERISRKPPPDCPLCGWSRKDHPLETHEWTHKNGECAGDDTVPCLKRQLAQLDEKRAELKIEHDLLFDQLAAANAKLQEAARLAQNSAKQADKMVERGEAFERAREALSAIEQMIRGGTKWRESDILAIIDAYFATGEKEG